MDLVIYFIVGNSIFLLGFIAGAAMFYDSFKCNKQTGGYQPYLAPKNPPKPPTGEPSVKPVMPCGYYRKEGSCKKRKQTNSRRENE